MLPVLEAVADGEEQPRRALADTMADHFGRTADERTQMLPSGRAPVIRSRTGWALMYLKQAGLVSSLRRGWYEITLAGKDVLAAATVSIDNDFLMSFERFGDFRTRSHFGDAASAVENTSPSAASPQRIVTETPDEALESVYNRIRAAAELINTVKRADAAFFEELVIDMLVHMGYGGNRAEAARAVARSGDGGIDGVIDEDRLGLDSIYVQAKRWESSVGRPEIQKFAGALQGQRATKGIFLTTSTFSRDATEYAQRIGTRIVGRRPPPCRVDV